MAKLTIGAITTGLQTGITATGAVTPTAGLDTSGITGDWTIKVNIPANTAAKNVRIAIETSVNAFTAATQEMVLDISGAIGAAYDKVFSVRKYQCPASVIGTSSAVTRANVQAITASDSLSIQAWIEYQS